MKGTRRAGEQSPRSRRPIALFGCALWIDWRLGLLAIVAVPLHVSPYSISVRGMNEKTVEMDRRLADVSSAMVEFVTGISVVKAFGRVGRAHWAYLDAAEGFSRFYGGGPMPLTNIACAAFAWVSVPVILLINLGAGSLMVHSGAVTLSQVLATTLVALVLPTTLMTIVVVSWSRQIAGAAALRLCNILDTPILPAPQNPRKPEGALVEIDHVSFSYGDALAVDEVTLNLRLGTITALLGPSGSLR